MSPPTSSKHQQASSIFSVSASESHSVLASLSLCSRPAGPNPSISPWYQSKLNGGWGWRGGARSHRGGLFQRPAGVRAHLPAPPGWAVPQQPLRGPVQSGTDADVCQRRLRHGHRQHLWAGCSPPLQHYRVGQKHPILPRTACLRAGQPRHTVPNMITFLFFSFLFFSFLFFSFLF